jgi:tyrosine-protein kinase Etk/Wzc
MDSQNKSSQNLVLDFIKIILNRKLLVFGIVFFTSVITAVYSLVMDKTYEATAVIMPPGDSSNPLTAMLGSLPLGGLIGGLGGEGVSGNYFTEILNSTAMRHDVIEHFNLRAHYKVEGEKIEDIVKKFAKYCTSSLDMESGMINVRARDKIPEMTKKIVDYMVERLQEMHLELKVRHARSKREFIASEVAQVRVELDSLQNEMLDFQDATHLLEPDIQGQVIMQGYSTIKEQALQKELELKMALLNLPGDHPKITKLQSELNTVQQMLDSLFYKGDEGIFIALQQLPKSSINYFELMRALEIANQKLVFMLAQLEQARLDEVDQTEVLKIIDPAVVPEKRIKPKRSFMVLSSAFIAFIIAALLALFMQRLNDDSEFRAQWRSLGDALRNKTPEQD